MSSQVDSELRVQYRLTIVKPNGWKFQPGKWGWMPPRLLTPLKSQSKETVFLMKSGIDAERAAEGLRREGLWVLVEPVALVVVRRNEESKRWEIAS